MPSRAVARRCQSEPLRPMPGKRRNLFDYRGRKDVLMWHCNKMRILFGSEQYKLMAAPRLEQARPG